MQIIRVTHHYVEFNDFNEPEWKNQITIFKNVVEAHTEWQPTNGINGSYWLIIGYMEEHKYKEISVELEHDNNSFDIFEIRERISE